MVLWLSERHRTICHVTESQLLNPPEQAAAKQAHDLNSHADALKSEEADVNQPTTADVQTFSTEVSHVPLLLPQSCTGSFKLVKHFLVEGFKVLSARGACRPLSPKKSISS